MKKLFLLGTLLISSTALLSGCKDERQISRDIVRTDTYDLIYFDQESIGSKLYSSHRYVPYDVIGYVKNNKSKQFSIKGTKVNEYVQLKWAKKPKVTITTHYGNQITQVNIYRGPYQEYVQPAANGVVTSK